jgi:hypothetical protein
VDWLDLGQVALLAAWFSGGLLGRPADSLARAGLDRWRRRGEHRHEWELRTSEETDLRRVLVFGCRCPLGDGARCRATLREDLR